MFLEANLGGDKQESPISTVEEDGEVTGWRCEATR